MGRAPAGVDQAVTCDSAVIFGPDRPPVEPSPPVTLPAADRPRLIGFRLPHTAAAQRPPCCPSCSRYDSQRRA